MWIEEIKNMSTPKAWDVAKTVIPEASVYADKSGFSKKAGLELLKTGYEAGLVETQQGKTSA